MKKNVLSSTLPNASWAHKGTSFLIKQAYRDRVMELQFSVWILTWTSKTNTLRTFWSRFILWRCRWSCWKRSSSKAMATVSGGWLTGSINLWFQISSIPIRNIRWWRKKSIAMSMYFSLYLDHLILKYQVVW